MNNKLYAKLAGRCHIHGARTRPVKGWRHNTVCEVTAEAIQIRKSRKGKIWIRRKARRRNW
ncbi:MAG: hypothetical protein KDH96_12335, partial [Candidatus Riesia sp.]|nr:hypothetical protein [Candidatus Riesia sp.]